MMATRGHRHSNQYDYAHTTSTATGTCEGKDQDEGWPESCQSGVRLRGSNTTNCGLGLGLELGLELGSGFGLGQGWIRVRCPCSAHLLGEAVKARRGSRPSPPRSCLTDMLFLLHKIHVSIVYQILKDHVGVPLQNRTLQHFAYIASFSS